jgi:ribosome-binding protein aMBF1 (putative translation factor)
MLNECFKCGVSGDKVRLYNAISSKGVVKICGDCNAVEGLPVIRRPTTDQLENSQKQKSVRDMLSGIEKGKMTTGREPTLRELVDKSLKERLARQPSDLIDNFHWEIQRIRRNRKITREQFAKGINESEAVVRMIEQGILPNNDYKIVTKIENFLGINLKKQGVSKTPEIRQRLPQVKPLNFNRESADNLKIADLKEMKKKKEDAKKSIDGWEEETSQDDEKFLDDIDEDIFDEE